MIATVALLVSATAASAGARLRRTTYTLISTTPAGRTPHFPAFDPTRGLSGPARYPAMAGPMASPATHTTASGPVTGSVTTACQPLRRSRQEAS